MKKESSLKSSSVYETEHIVSNSFEIRLFFSEKKKKVLNGCKRMDT